METKMRRVQMIIVCVLSVLAWGFVSFLPDALAADPPAPSPTVEEQKGTPSDQGPVEERGIQRAPIPGSMLPGGRSLAPGGMSVAPLTKAECTGLGCKAVDDNTCPDVGLLRQRCVCQGGGKGVCIDEVK